MAAAAETKRVDAFFVVTLSVLERRKPRHVESEYDIIGFSATMMGSGDTKSQWTGACKPYYPPGEYDPLTPEMETTGVTKQYDTFALLWYAFLREMNYFKGVTDVTFIAFGGLHDARILQHLLVAFRDRLPADPILRAAEEPSISIWGKVMPLQFHLCDAEAVFAMTRSSLPDEMKTRRLFYEHVKRVYPLPNTWLDDGEFTRNYLHELAKCTAKLCYVVPWTGGDKMTTYQIPIGAHYIGIPLPRLPKESLEFRDSDTLAVFESVIFGPVRDASFPLVIDPITLGVSLDPENACMRGMGRSMIATRCEFTERNVRLYNAESVTAVSGPVDIEFPARAPLLSFSESPDSVAFTTEDSDDFDEKTVALMTKEKIRCYGDLRERARAAGSAARLMLDLSQTEIPKAAISSLSELVFPPGGQKPQMESVQNYL